MSRQASAPGSAPASMVRTKIPKEPQHGPNDGAADLPFAPELCEVAKQLAQGAAPAVYQRLVAYRDGLRTAQAVIAAFQQHAGDGKKRDDGGKDGND